MYVAGTTGSVLIRKAASIQRYLMEKFHCTHSMSWYMYNVVPYSVQMQGNIQMFIMDRLTEIMLLSHNQLPRLKNTGRERESKRSATARTLEKSGLVQIPVYSFI